MRIILTHEQADFDAMASLLGASILDEGAVAILPRRMNRNVKAFLTLYGVELPFEDQRDLPKETVSAITLVDTQSMISVKGVTTRTMVQVIDHHPLRENLPAEWDVTIEEIGATTTLLIEILRERDVLLSPIQATLLLLGIYEDTGSLTYTRTTARDLKAAAYLLDQGASLTIANNFLNHPLSQPQQALYDTLRQSAEHFHLNGHTVIVASGDAHEMDEEVSSIAHKLRDLLDPDALFLLVTTKSGVQLIARSTTDDIDVSEIAEHFGGGGHERAAAGLIRERDLDSVRGELIRILPDHIRPSITVAQIMSLGPQVISADTMVEEVAERMQRYGYEGFPVASQGRVVGLITRRDVDKALAHKMNLPAYRLMNAGSYTILPEDSIERLQTVMTDSGWGQVPVVNPENGEIIGIVTRTDLLKTLLPRDKQPGIQNLAAKLEMALPPERSALLKAVANIATEQHCAVYIVGGFVRDLLLDHPGEDFDLVVEGDAISLAKALAKRFGGRITSHARFGTAKWHIQPPFLLAQLSEIYPGLSSRAANLPVFLDLISARTEFYTHPTALPTVERGSIKLDLHRRDFTINTLALRLDGHHYGELHDYWGGLNDLRHGLVRVLHSLSFIDDPTRMLRAVRFEQRFGFRIEARTLELLTDALPLLDRVSGDRVRHELDRILEDRNATQILARLDQLELLETIHPDLRWDDWLRSRLEALPVKVPGADWGLETTDTTILKRNLVYILWLLRLPDESARAVCRRLKLSAELSNTVRIAGELWRDLSDFSEVTPAEVVAKLESVPPEARYAVYLATSDIHLRKTFQMYGSHWQKIRPTISGHDLKRRGLAPGPAYRRILEGLRTAWLNGEITSMEEEAALLERLISEVNPSEAVVKGK